MARKILRENARSRLLHRCLDIATNWLALASAYAIKEQFGIGIPTEPLSAQVARGLQFL